MDDSNSTFKTTEQAEAVVNPTINEVQRLLKANGDPIIPESLNKLKNWMMRMEKGNRVDDRTPIYKTESRDKVVNGFTKRAQSQPAKEILSKVRVMGYNSVWWDVEMSQAKNIGPQSIFKPWSEDGPAKVKAVMTDKPPLKQLNWKAWELALSDVTNLLPKRSIHRVSIDDALHGWGGNPKYALDATTNAGYPTWVRKWRSSEGKGNTDSDAEKLRRFAEQYIVRQARALYEAAGRASSYKAIIPAYVTTASQRTVSKGPKPLESTKVKRVVLAMPKEEAVAGKTVMVPMQLALSKVRNPKTGVRLIPAWSPMPTLDKNMQLFLRYASDHGRTVLSGDISSFDATLPPFVMWGVAQAMSEWMDKDTAQLFLAIMHADIYGTTVITPSGIVPQGPSSVKSGSIFTSVIGCIANYAIQRYGKHAHYYDIDDQCVMGDDFIIDGDGVSPESVSAAFADFGMECHPDKQFMERDQLHFLQRTHSLGIPGGQGSVYRVLGSTMSVEDDTQLNYDERTRYAYAFQALARLENANFNPLFEMLVHFVAAGDAQTHLCRDLNPNVILSRAGDYAERKINEAKIKPWKSTGTGVPFERWAVNRVLRGEVLPPPGVDRFKAIYGISYQSVAI